MESPSVETMETAAEPAGGPPGDGKDRQGGGTGGGGGSGGSGKGPVAYVDPTPWDLYKQVREEIGGEWTNITSRIGWLVTSQSFLFVALVVAGGGQPIARSALFPLLPLIGLAASLSVFFAVWAALHRIKWLRCSQEKLADVLERRCNHVFRCGAGAKSHLRRSAWNVHMLGALPTLAIPVSLLLGWMHVLGRPGIERMADWSDKGTNAVAFVFYVLVIVAATLLWWREVLSEEKDRAEGPTRNNSDDGTGPAADPSGHGGTGA